MDRLILLLSVSLLVVSSITLIEAQKLPPPEKQLPPQVELEAEYIGKAILVTWKLPIEETNTTTAYKWVLQRDINGSGFVDIANGERDPNNKPLSEGQEVRYYLDKVSSRGSTYNYKIFYVSVDGREITESNAKSSVFIDKDEPLIHVGKGNYLETTRILTPFNKPIIRVLFDSFFDTFPLAYAPTSNLEPIITSSLNPKDEPYLFNITPLPNPDLSSDCNQVLEILYKPSLSGGQTFEVFATILESQIIVRNQHLYDNLADSNKRIFNEWYLIPNSEESIQNFEALEVQLDIDSSLEIDPNNHRQLSIYGVNIYIPTGSSSC